MDEISELLGRQLVRNFHYSFFGGGSLRRYAREWVERYPSIARLYKAIAGPGGWEVKGQLKTTLRLSESLWLIWAIEILKQFCRSLRAGR